MNPWLLALRPKTLPAAVAPVCLANFSALGPGVAGRSFSWLLFASTLLSCIGIQIATNLFNDAIDARKGADTDARLGPIRATASGLLSSKAVFAAAFATCALSALLALPLLWERGWIIMVIGVVSLGLAYGYTGGPYPLAYRGLGELFVILFFGFVAVIGAYFAQFGLLPPGEMWLAGAQMGLYSSVLIAINNLRDREEDQRSEKRTLAVRWGIPFARREIALFCVLPVALSLAAALGRGWFFLLWPALAVLPLGLVIATGVYRHEPSRVYNRFLALGGLQLVLFTVVSAISFSGR
ncbi:MAG: 1,4-dihydroxy-2-naphthoate octaprenyltransferase [Verrucomicrobiota bacterium]